LQAAVAAAELAALEATPAAPSAGRIKIESFEEFQHSSKRQRDDGSDEQAAPKARATKQLSDFVKVNLREIFTAMWSILWEHAPFLYF